MAIVLDFTREDEKSTTYRYRFDYEDRLPDLKTTHPVVIRDLIRQGKREEHYITIRIDKDMKGFFLGYGMKKIMCVGRKIFMKSKWISRYGKKDGKFFGNLFDSEHTPSRIDILNLFLPLVGRECLMDENNDKEHCFIDKTIFNGILNGKITNRKDMVRRFFKSHYHLSDIDASLYEKAYLNFLNKHNHMIYISLFTIIDALGFRKNLDELMRYFYKMDEGYVKSLRDDEKKKTREWQQLFSDLCRDAMLLEDFFVNPRWSTKRMNIEHQRNHKEIMNLLAENQDATPYYDAPVLKKEKGLDAEMLNSDYVLYMESKEMEHCIYYNYSNSIRNRNYLAFRISKPERCTVGISVNHSDRKLVLDQIRSYGNRTVKESTQEIVKSFLNNNIKTLCDSFFAPVSVEFENSDCICQDCIAEEDLPF